MTMFLTILLGALLITLIVIVLAMSKELDLLRQNIVFLRSEVTRLDEDIDALYGDDDPGDGEIPIEPLKTNVVAFRQRVAG